MSNRRSQPPAAAAAAICQSELLSLPPSSVSCGTDLMDAVTGSKCFSASWPPSKKNTRPGHKEQPDTVRLSVNRIHQCWRWWDSSQAAAVAAAVWSRGSEASSNRAGVKLGGACQRGLENQLWGSNVGDSDRWGDIIPSHWQRYQVIGWVVFADSCSQTRLHCHRHCFFFFFVIGIINAVCAREVSRLNPRGPTSGVRSLPFH